jgi:hypothetical protein
MITNFTFIPTDDVQAPSRRGQWMCVHCCHFVEFSAEGFGRHIKTCVALREFEESRTNFIYKTDLPVAPLLLFQ